jgi:Protein of unknown function (DUF1266)
MSWLVTIALLWFALRMAKVAYRAFAKALPAGVEYKLEGKKNGWLALAHPAAAQSIFGGFADEEQPTLTPELAQSLRPALKYFLGLKANLSDAQIRDQLNTQLFTRWYQFDLDALSPTDNVRDAIAFACARAAYAIRVAAIIGWLDPSVQWQLLELNGKRAAECFSNWEDFGRACARGRLQWISQSRADSLGTAFSEADAQTWSAQKNHPWNALPWA